MKFAYIVGVLAGCVVVGVSTFDINGILGGLKENIPKMGWRDVLGKQKNLTFSAKYWIKLFGPKSKFIRHLMNGDGMFTFSRRNDSFNACPLNAKHSERSGFVDAIPKAVKKLLPTLQRIIPSEYKVDCLVKFFSNSDKWNRFLTLLESVTYSCRHRKPSKSECRKDVTFRRNIYSKDFEPPGEWPCLQESSNLEHFYVQLHKIYNLLNPCSSCKQSKLDFRHRKMTHNNGISKFYYGIWWFWWYFISGQVVFVLAPSPNELIKATVYDDGLIFDNKFSRSRPTKILVHGYINYHNSYGSRMLKEAYLQRSAYYNIVIVDWSSMSYEPYPLSRHRIIPVAKAIVGLILRLMHDYGVELSSFHIIGHSLGAHIGGIVGNLINEDDSIRNPYEASHVPKLSRVTGLDPALPLFQKTPAKWRIGRSSAKFVDVIHTSSYTFGMAASTGHADFYPNGGFPSQPGCGLSFIGIKLGPLSSFEPVCAHMRAVSFFAESIGSPRGFMSRKCSSFMDFRNGACNSNPIAYMGEDASPTTRGDFYFYTGTEPPFGLGKEGVRTT